jgi:hypothetical protein
VEKIKTVLHSYYFDISKTEEQTAYETMVATIRESFKGDVWSWDLTGGRTSNVAAWDFDDKIRKLGTYAPGQRQQQFTVEIELETKHLFADQWNSAPMPGFESGARLFNWSENVYLNRSIRTGCWIEQNAAMAEVLRNTHKCGFCGKQEPAQKGYVFCPHCIDSEFLTKDRLPLTRMVPVRDERKKRAELTQAEKDYLYPLYDEAQKNGKTARGIARLTKAKADIERQFEKTVRVATVKRDAARWIVANIPGALDNWIYYDHTDRHCFGWRNLLTDDEVSALLDVISEFPFQYELKCADGRTLSN